MGQPPSSPVIGIVGIGRIGLPVTVNLLRAGFRVVGFRRTDRHDFVDAGGVALDSPAEVAAQADILLLCLPGTAAQVDALEGPNGLLQSLAPGKIVIELGTYSREQKIAQASLIEAKGARMLEAEVSGSPPMVADRQAALFVGGSQALVAQCKPVLDAITANHFHLGDIGSAVAMKLINNALVAIHTLAAAEAMNMGVRAGFDPHRVAEVLSKGSGNSAMLTIRAPIMASRSFTPAPGPFSSLQKYLELGAQLASDLACSTPLFSAASAYFLRGLEAGMDEEDISAVIKLLEAESGDKQTKAKPQ